MNIIPSKAIEHTLPPLDKSDGSDVLFSQPRSVQHIDEICRSLSEGMDYCPWWRSLVAMIYYNEWNAQRKAGNNFDLPDFEDDPLVVSFFMFKAYGRTPDPELTRAIRWASRGQIKSKVNMAKIRALAVSGASNEFIAEMFCTSPKNIEVYLSLFFDIRQCLKSKAWMDTFILPEFNKADEILSALEVREAVWMLFGYYGGTDAICQVLSGDINFADRAEIDAFVEQAKNMVAVQAVMHVSSNLVLNPSGRASEWMKFIELKNTEANAAQGSSPQNSLDDDGSWDDWMDEAFDRGVFSSDVKSIVKGDPKKADSSSSKETFIEAEVVKRESGSSLPPMIGEDGLLKLQQAFSVSHT